MQLAQAALISLSTLEFFVEEDEGIVYMQQNKEADGRAR